MCYRALLALFDILFWRNCQFLSIEINICNLTSPIFIITKNIPRTNKSEKKKSEWAICLIIYLVN